jgi:predicted component of type VI protein secretion system
MNNKRIWKILCAVCLVIAGCKKAEPYVPTKSQIAIQAESLVNFSLVNSKDAAEIINNSEDTGKLIQAIMQYNKSNDAKILEALKRQISDPALIKRITIIQGELETRK